MIKRNPRLDQNLPIMVERLVRSEIKRLAEESKRR